MTVGRTCQEADILVGILLECGLGQHNTERKRRRPPLRPSHKPDAGFLVGSLLLSRVERGYPGLSRSAGSAGKPCDKILPGAY